MRYIDADRLKAEIEKHIKEVKDAAERFTPNMGFFDAKLSGIYDVMTILDSLQQEQPCEDLEKEVEWEWVHREKQEVDLIECAEMDKDEFVRFARHFYELGKNSK